VVAGQAITIEVTRGEVVESVHTVHAVIADRHGALRSWGDRRRPTIPRSAIKAIQAIPIAQSGALEALSISREELALACSSHSAEPAHVAAVAAWLDRLELSEADLECGPGIPINAQAARDLFAGGGGPSPIYNGCSGKHTGFLSVARHLGEPVAGYIERDSLVQQRVTGSIEAFTGLDLARARSGRDGCGIPVFAIPLERLAFAMARLVDPVDLDATIAAATVPVVAAARLAFWVSGTDRTEVDVTERANQPLVVKAGAEGVMMAGLPDQGLGIALKAADGADRAAGAAIRAVLAHLDVLDAEEVRPGPIRNKAGLVIGGVGAIVPGTERTSLSPVP
jgi:L-asparaginase II